ncbi:MAG: DUF2125 domain-containing protein [Pararhizobium sp.]
MRTRSKLAAVLVVLVLAALAYTGFWFYAAKELKARADAFITGLTGKDIDAACRDLDVGGFPATIGVTCSSVAAADARKGRSFAAGAFESDANIFKLGHIDSHLEGPLTARDGDGARFKADWNSLVSHAVFWREGLLRGRVEASGLHATIDGPSVPGTVSFSVPAMKATLRRNNRNLDAEFNLQGLAAKGTGPLSALPVANIAGSATLDSMATLLSGRKPVPDHLLRGTSGTLTALTASIGNGATISVSGPFAFDTKGRLSGRFSLAIDNLAAWQAAVNAVLPGASETISSATAMLTALGGSNGKASITVTADHGRLSLGLIPIGKLPPI